MKIATIKPIGLAVTLSACLASVMFGQTSTTMALGYNSSGQNSINGEANPFYTGTISTYTGGTVTDGLPTGTLTSSFTNVLTLCDDLADNVYWGQQFAVLTTDLSAFTGASPNVSSVYYGTTAPPAIQTQDYVAAAILAVDLASDPTNPTKQDIDGYAIWDIFQPAATIAQLTSVGSGDVSAVETAAAKALAEAANLPGAPLTGAQEEFNSGYDVTIYTPTFDGTTTETSGQIPANSPGTRPQEIITLTYVPEPSTWAVLGFDLVGAGILGLYFRRRRSQGRS
jgi:hypothetical protein